MGFFKIEKMKILKLSGTVYLLSAVSFSLDVNTCNYNNEDVI